METTDYVSYPVALALKKAGFDEPCDKWIASKSFSYYDANECSDHNAIIEKGWIISQKEKEKYDQEALPYLTLWQAQKWLHTKGFELEVPYVFHDGESLYDWNVYDMRSGDLVDCNRGASFKSHETALADGIASAMRLMKDRDHEKSD